MEFFRVAEEAKSIMFDAITIPELVIDVTDLLKKGLYYKNQMQLFTWWCSRGKYSGKSPKIEDKHPKTKDKHPKIEDKNSIFSSAKLLPNMSKTANFSRRDLG